MKPDWELRFAGDLAFQIQDFSEAVNIYTKLFERIRVSTFRHATTRDRKEHRTSRSAAARSS